MVKRILLVVLVAVGLTAIVLFLVARGYKPKQREVSATPFERTPARVERGRYLVENVLGCMDCHSRKDFKRFGFPPTGPTGAGGDCMTEQMGFPGTLCFPNITPEPETGLGAWTDEQILRAIREGVDNKGVGLAPLMPYNVYKILSDEDGRAVVTYLRTLAPAKNPIPDPQLKFPLSFLFKLAPAPLKGPVAGPDRNDKVAYGRYLATVSGCHFCHTPVDKTHQPLPGQDFSGGQEFRGPWGALRSANLTPHATGLGDRTEQQFVGMFKAFALPPDQIPEVPPEKNTVMPWLTRAGMSEADLGAIYTFLKSVPPLERVVEKRPIPQLPDAGPEVGGADAPGNTPPAAPEPSLKTP